MLEVNIEQSIYENGFTSNKDRSLLKTDLLKLLSSYLKIFRSFHRCK